jgi:methionyl-tRNA formyltransferase
MRVLVLTSSTRGFGAYCLPRLAEAEGIEVDMVVYNRGEGVDRKKYMKRKAKKVLKIGPMGAMNGVRMRSWFNEDVRGHISIEDVRKVSEKKNISLKQVPKINCKKTVRHFKKSKAKVGLSLGNGYIGKKIFEVPKYGMINIHHEKLPEYQGAQSVIWQIYNESSQTGYTIHKIDERIDNGDILYSEEMPIVFRDSLSETVSYNYARLYKSSSDGLIQVLKEFSTYWKNAEPQQGGNSYTTPSFWQYLRMVYNHRRLARQERGKK